MGEVTALTAVLDTSVLWGRDLRGELIRAIDAGRFVGVWSDWIVAELWRGLAWQWAEERGVTVGQRRAMSDSANQLMRLLGPRLKLVSFSGDPRAEPWPQLADPNDEPIWTTAVAAHASHVVSSNTKDFPPNIADAGSPPRHSYFGIEYLTPAAFLELVWHDSVADDEQEPAEA